MFLFSMYCLHSSNFIPWLFIVDIFSFLLNLPILSFSSLLFLLYLLLFFLLSSCGLLFSFFGLCLACSCDCALLRVLQRGPTCVAQPAMRWGKDLLLPIHLFLRFSLLPFDLLFFHKFFLREEAAADLRPLNRKLIFVCSGCGLLILSFLAFCFR